MKTFLRRLLIFGIFPIIYCGANYLYNSTTETCGFPKKDVIILGDSHPKTSINPKSFPSAANISQLSEPYTVSFWKFKTLLKEHKPKYLILGFAPHNISSFNDLKFSDRRWSERMFERTYKFQELDNLQDTEVDYYAYYKTLFTKYCLYPGADHCTYIGKFSPRKGSNVKNAEDAIERHFYNDAKLLSYSETTINFLDSIVSLAKTNGVQPVLVSHPVYKEYFDLIPKDIMNRYKELKTKFSSEGVVILDQTEMILPDSLFFNVDHLNKKGAKIFTSSILNVIENGN